MEVPAEVLKMGKKERKIIRMFSELSLKKKNRVVDVLHPMLCNSEAEEMLLQYDKKENIDVEKALQRSLAAEEDDGTRGDCDRSPRITKKQLDRELDEYMAADPRLFN